jgi:hypothetical protein
VGQKFHDFGILDQDVVAWADLPTQKGSSMSISVPVNPNRTNMHNITHTRTLPTVVMDDPTQTHGEETHRPSGTSTLTSTLTSTSVRPRPRRHPLHLVPPSTPTSTHKLGYKAPEYPMRHNKTPTAKMSTI